MTITEINDNSFIDTSSYLAFDINGHNKDFSSDGLAQRFCMALVKSAQIGQNSSGDFNASTNLDGFYEISSPFNRLDTQITMLQDELVSLSTHKVGGIRGVAVKCLDITKNSDCEGSSLERN